MSNALWVRCARWFAVTWTGRSLEELRPICAAQYFLTRSELRAYLRTVFGEQHAGVERTMMRMSTKQFSYFMGLCTGLFIWWLLGL